MSEVIQLPGTERDISTVHGTDDPHTIPIEAVIDSDYVRDLHIGLLIGRLSNDEFFMASTHADIGKILVLLERAKRQLIESIE